MSRKKSVAPEQPAGILRGEGDLAASGRWVDGQWVRFVRGRAQKMGGWEKRVSAAFIGICRNMHSWNDLTARSLIALGTTRKLYAVTGGVQLTDITPATGAAAALTNAFTTANGGSNVVVAHAAHGKVIGQIVTFSSASTVAGLDMNGEWEIISVPSAGTYVFTHTGIANATTGPTGSANATYDLPPGLLNPTQGFGWGVGGWGDGTWGTPRPTSNIVNEAYYWSLSNFGKLLIAAPYAGILYSWDPTTTPTPRATPVGVAEAPGAMRGFFMTPERFVVAYGASADTSNTVDHMLLRWHSQGDMDDWTPTSTNTASSRRLTVGKKIMGGGAAGQGLSLIWTDAALYAHQYTGSRFIFDTRLIGDGCGLAGPQAFTFVRGQAFWFGPGGFQTYSGGVTRVQNSDEVSEWVFDQLRNTYETKTVCFFNQRYNEVWWLFVPDGETEPTLYAAVNLTDMSWVGGTLARTTHTRIDGGTDNRPILASTDGYIYTHEVGVNADGAVLDSWIQASYFELDDGDTQVEVWGYMPDFARQTGDITLEVMAKDRSGGGYVDRQVATIRPGTGVEDLHLSGRLVSYKLRSNVVDGDYRLGKDKFEISIGSKRR
jgi:hypothetical protein